jgi:hypothetical protein
MNATILKGATRSKTVYLGLVILVVGVIQANAAALAPFIPEKYFGLFNMMLGVLVVVVRFFTDQSLEEKGTMSA